MHFLNPVHLVNSVQNRPRILATALTRKSIRGFHRFTPIRPHLRHLRHLRTTPASGSAIALNSRLGNSGIRSGPSRQNLPGLHHLFGRAGKVEFEFSRPAGDLDLDGVQAVFLHRQTELFIDFLDAVLLEAFAHARVSARAGPVAM
jgi:hypothetical protein